MTDSEDLLLQTVRDEEFYCECSPASLWARTGLLRRENIMRRGKSLSSAQSQCMVDEDHPSNTVEEKAQKKKQRHPKGQKGGTPDESTQFVRRREVRQRAEGCLPH